MKVKKLIALLKKMPQNIDVGFSAHDNNDWEIASYITGIVLFDKKVNELPDYIGGSDVGWYNAQPERAVVLRG